MNWFLNQILDKILLTFRRVYHYLSTLSKRLIRLWKHFSLGVLSINQESFSKWWDLPGILNKCSIIGFWFLEFLILILDLFGIGEIYGILSDWIKFNSRKLYDWELEIARNIYKDSINYKLITVDEYAIFGLKIPQAAKAYVSFHTINTEGSMENGLFIHELIHIWQYQKFGSPYLIKALQAQNSVLQYNYGGASALRAAIAKKLDFLSFNFEQQGDLVQDYYRIKNGYRPLWGAGKREDLKYYEHFIQQLKS